MIMLSNHFSLLELVQKGFCRLHSIKNNGVNRIQLNFTGLFSLLKRERNLFNPVNGIVFAVEPD